MKGVTLGFGNVTTEETTYNCDGVGTGDTYDTNSSSRGSSHSTDIVG